MTEPLTATELLRRRAEWERQSALKLNAAAQPAIAAATRRLFRILRRRQLREALAGSWELRWGYCWARHELHAKADLMAYGKVRESVTQSAYRLVHQYRRLERIAAAKGGIEMTGYSDSKLLSVAHGGAVLRVRVDYWAKPVPFRWGDYSAVDDATYDGPGHPVGHGATEAEAVADLLEQMELFSGD